MTAFDDASPDLTPPALVLDARMKLVAPTEADIVCDPVWPSIANEIAYHNALTKPLVAMDVEVMELARELAKPIRVATDASPIDQIRKKLDKFAERWTGRWDSMEERIAKKFATGAWTATDNGMRASFKKAGFTIAFKPTKPMLLAFNARVQTNVNLIRSIPQQYLKDVSQAVWETTTTTGDMNALYERIQAIHKIADRRAALIARDQNNKAKASFENTRCAELGITEAEWQHSGGGQEKYRRPTHVKAGAERTRFSILKGWFDKAVGKLIWPGTEINCRCSRRNIIPGLRRRKS